MTRRAILIDGSALVYKCYFSIDPAKNDLEDPQLKKRFFSTLIYQIKKWMNLNHYTFGLAVFDIDRKSFRSELFAEYKSNRDPTPPTLLEWLPEAIEKITELGIKTVYCPRGYEGDDLIGTVSKQLTNCDFKVDIFTTDQDLLQLVNYLVSIYKIKNAFMLEIYNHLNFTKLNEGLTPSQIPLLKALAGDQCDNYPGVPGVGLKTAQKLINKYKTLNNLLNSATQIEQPKLRKSILENQDLLLNCLKLSTIQTNIKFKYILDDCFIKHENNSGLR
ncbi:5'-3' exonuclease [Candidatus Mycoplasma haematominutum]|uniref:5'-3' exonuclease n=1 Tax=Candidatus Mycoplasma haematominutum 'Birmingham 1' TaxID=1116213 RepID=G8C2Y0_9MOLU|nr:5'-3' exonuclease H3TH domain-containing protein [Candidatus Mycoplasma haematominutum]CCE66678.1 DNA polymerase I: 5'-3' exonuclease [Candidatus Mycoplasma haematominutum 'Birmingham 1']